ncbi:hypothetical protein QYM36_018387 [Artemia franciscana]|uniref:C2H2-type domain-containing protein n=1 Tax=Artemia franciscana TaxID=6661 RepID=A0AA88KRK1_ARTSF|nr:hypothetical protein QYM36_018387 [Artemia franciscana]
MIQIRKQELATILVAFQLYPTKQQNHQKTPKVQKIRPSIGELRDPVTQLQRIENAPSTAETVSSPSDGEESGDMIFENAMQKLKRHLRVHFKCDVCGKTFSRAASLNTHQRVHTGERPFRCDSCDKTFTQATHLNTHQRVHTGEKPFRCDVCDKTFSQATHLNTHQRVHTGEKPFRCDVCEKTFSQEANLNTHQRMHSGEKPFICDECDKTFSQAAHLKKHHRVHMKEKSFK